MVVAVQAAHRPGVYMCFIFLLFAAFHPDCMWLEMVFLMAEAQEQGIPPCDFFKSIYGENNTSGVPQCAFYKAFAEAGGDQGLMALG